LQVQVEKYDAAVISPGPGRPEDAGALMDFVRINHESLPMLGVCLGHQALGMFFGAKLVKAQTPRHGKTDMITHQGNPVFKHIPESFPATRYHSLILEEIPSCLEVTCHCRDEVMGIAHRTLPLWGIQFHPESCMTPDGIRMISNFIEMLHA
jgi:anthranilate synthase/aminodeoxychorismate synthase-like glutamine amidotransferase